MAINVTHLRSFWAVASSGGFAAASRWLRVSQPNLTRQIKELEEGYGILLFSRNASRIELTPEGQALLPIVSRIFEGVQEAEQFLKQYQRDDIRLCAVTTDVTTRLISALQSFSADLKLTVSVGPSSAVYQALLARTCEIGILTMPEPNPTIATLEIGRYPLLAVLPEGHPLLRFDTVSITDLSREQIITGSMATQSRHHLDRAARAAGVVLEIAQQIDGYEMIGELVRLGLGVGVIGYTGIVERGLGNVKPIEECREVIPVHFACLALNRRVRLIDHLFNVVAAAIAEGSVSPLQFAGRNDRA